MKKLMKKDFVYLEEFLDFCENNFEVGLFGIKGR